jgi:hypothetical protein
MRYCAWALLVLGLLLSAPAAARAQEAPGGGVSLGRNFPNPFNPETFIPFRVEAQLFMGNQRPLVTLKVYNVLAQLVSVPILQGSGERLENLPLSWNGSGDYTAYWDGKYQATEREAASGVYVYQLSVRWNENGKLKTETTSKKMTVMK